MEAEGGGGGATKVKCLGLTGKVVEIEATDATTVEQIESLVARELGMESLSSDQMYCALAFVFRVGEPKIYVVKRGCFGGGGGGPIPHTIQGKAIKDNQKMTWKDITTTLQHE
eukprot:TRINITY_DN2437_c0_g2_i4.p1 TRINITY_DN2437_c0_g2~~TRINITY_DN2437_c0_g2_i4.p1  ORF type:complete len:113 (+),score=4.59 TRINITY_DN2437_c0_g2_i4:196-534(+)